MDVKYIWKADTRTIRTSDMDAQGIPGWTTTTWNRFQTLPVQDAGGQWLVTNLPREFQHDPAPEPVAPTATASSSSTNKASSSK